MTDFEIGLKNMIERSFLAVNQGFEYKTEILKRFQSVF